ncbi:MAG: hypothetical protein NTV01_05360 [Bacteroidia bacterium]|nr:hypothetical protein [Bacteroidia bacterium]
MKPQILSFAFLFCLLPVINCFSQTETFPEPPTFKGYKGIPGRVSKYNNFNYLDIRDEVGKNNRQAMGHYWEIAYTYDSVFRQKRKFKDFVLNQIVEKNGTVFYQDTLQVHFVIPSDAGNIWGRLVLNNDKSYRLRLIREVPFVNKIEFDTKQVAVYEKYVDSIALPPRINYLPKSVITRAQHSKYDHQEFTWNIKDTLFRQKTMGPFWELKIDVRNSKNLVDKQISSVEILESYYRACVKAGGKIIKSRPRELLFTLPMTKSTLWCRITVSLDGVYFVRVLIEADLDKTIPEKLVSAPSNPVDSLRGKID